ncbi:MAG: DUF222 domain-containing protein [Acidimicrobiales bacterium]
MGNTDPWRQLSEQCRAVDAVGDAVGDLVQRVAATIDEGREQVTSPSPDRRGVARELAAAAARLRHAALALQVVSASLVAADQAHRADAETTTRKWLARHAGLSPRDASVLARCADTLDRYSLVRQAFLDGDLTVGHVDAIACIIPARLTGDALRAAIEMVAEIQDRLISLATDDDQSLSIAEYEAFCARVRHRLDTDGAPDRSAEPSRAWLHQLFNGRWAFTADLSAADGPLWATILADHLAAHPSEPAVSEAADESCETSAESPAEPMPQSERMAIAAGRLLLAGATADAPGRVGAFIHIDLDRLHPDPTPELADLLTDRPAHTEAGLDIDDDTFWALLAGADVTPIFNRNGTPLSYGRTRRLAPPMLRRALAHRDRTCRFPGCNAPPNRLEFHHLVHWEHQGTTDPPNLAGLCSSHHHDHHDRGWAIARDTDGRLAVTRPTGQPFTAQPAYLDRLIARRRAERREIVARVRELRCTDPSSSVGEGFIPCTDRRRSPSVPSMA